jgi:hypothetical protein
MRFVIAGYGRFGRLALERISRSLPDREVIVVEPQDPPPSAVLSSNVRWVSLDAVSFLQQTDDLEPEDVILPMVPFHLAAEWLAARSRNLLKTALPLSLQSLVPHPLLLDVATLCCSRADFLCPDDCPEGDACTVTGQPRDPLFSELERLRVPGYKVLVLRSSQILPGVGGYKLKALSALERSVTRGRFVIATSCKCHAILTGLEKS